MALWSLKRIELPIVTSPLISEVSVPVLMVDKDTGTIEAYTVLAQYVDKKLDVTNTLAELTANGYTPNDWTP